MHIKLQLLRVWNKAQVILDRCISSKLYCTATTTRKARQTYNGPAVLGHEVLDWPEVHIAS